MAGGGTRCDRGARAADRAPGRAGADAAGHHRIDPGERCRPTARPWRDRLPRQRGDEGYLKNPGATEENVAGGYSTSDLAVLYPDGRTLIRDRAAGRDHLGRGELSSIEVEGYAVTGTRRWYWRRWWRCPTSTGARCRAPSSSSKPEAPGERAEIIEFCRTPLARYSVRKRVVFLGPLPKPPRPAKIPEDSSAAATSRSRSRPARSGAGQPAGCDVGVRPLRKPQQEDLTMTARPRVRTCCLSREALAGIEQVAALPASRTTWTRDRRRVLEDRPSSARM